MNETEIELIKKKTELFFNLEDLASRKRDKLHTTARFYYCYYMYCFKGLTYAKIGESIARDHSTAIYALREMENMLDYKDVMTDNLPSYLEFIEGGIESVIEKFKIVCNILGYSAENINLKRLDSGNIEN
jgi:hypothetical protein